VYSSPEGCKFKYFDSRYDGVRISVYRNYPIDDMSQIYKRARPSEVPSMATLIVSIFVVIILGAASAFAYVVYRPDDRTGP
jgi:hypothetical protein